MTAAPALIAAIQAAATYGESEDPGVQIVAARRFFAASALNRASIIGQ